MAHSYTLSLKAAIDFGKLLLEKPKDLNVFF